jgi:TRAP-type C4-dicarboxylate transport system permease small subunit
VKIHGYVMNASASWTEETARYSFVWLNMLGASIAVKYKAHVGVDILTVKLSGNAKKIQQSILMLLIITAAAIFVVEGIRLTLAVTDQLSPAVRIPISLVYLAIPVSGFGMFVHGLCQLAGIVTGQEEAKGGHAHG